MTRLFLALAIGLALVGCETTSEPADSPQPSFAANSGVTQSVTGSAHRTASRPGFTGWRTFSFNARMKADGSVEGRFQVNNHGGSWMKGSVSCFTIVDNQAWVGVVAEQASREDLLGDRVFVVIDNGEGKNDPPDMSTGMPSLDPTPYETLEDFCAWAPFDGWSSRSFEIEAGNIKVNAAGGATVWNDGDNDKGCSSWPGYVDWCWDSHYTLTSVMTPSGNEKYTYRSHGTQTETWYVWWPGTYTYDWRYHYNFLIKQGELQVDSWNDTYTEEFPGGTCTYTYQYHYANGRVTRDLNDWECHYY
jgi:hypothetical protein